MRTPIEEIPISDWPVGEPGAHVLDECLIWESPGHSGWYQPGQVVLGCIRKQAEGYLLSVLLVSLQGWSGMGTQPTSHPCVLRPIPLSFFKSYFYLCVFCLTA